ncbi:hypothetical protein J7I96_24965, partial [Bacillus sp. ISL-78]|nr:hypothetical protein [Bacillus sp. ISL-78]
LIGAGVRDSCGKCASRGDPAGESRGGSPTARGKRVPGVEVNVQTLKGSYLFTIRLYDTLPIQEK